MPVAAGFEPLTVIPDNAPVALIEACAMGLPVVSTAVGGIPDVLQDGDTGLLVPDDDVEAMARAIVRLVSDSRLTGRLSANGRRMAGRSSWERVQPQWERLFAELSRPPVPGQRGIGSG